MDTSDGARKELNLGLQANALFKSIEGTIVTQSKFG